MCFACGKDPDISFVYDQIFVNMGEIYTIEDDDIKIDDSKHGYEIIIQDTTIAKIENMVIIPLKKGETRIRFQLEEDSDVYYEIPLIVTNNVYATSAQIEKENVQINMHISTMATNKVTLNEGCNEYPTITYDKDVIGYNYQTGVITAKKEGSTTVVILFGSCNVSFKVNVVNVVYTKQLEVNDCTVYNGSSGVFGVNVFPDNANTFEFYTTSVNIDVEKNGSFTAKSCGDATITIKYLPSEDSEYMFKTFKVNIIELPEGLEATISSVDGAEINYFLKEKQYKITIVSPIEVSREKLAFSENILVQNIDIQGNKIDVNFTFKEAGNVGVCIYVNLDEYTRLEKTINVDVNSYDDIKVSARWFIYEQSAHADGKYHVYLNAGNNVADSLKFSLVIDSRVIDENYKVYQVVSGGRILVLDALTDSKQYNFEPTDIGEFNFEFVINDTVIESIVVLVENTL